MFTCPLCSQRNLDLVIRRVLLLAAASRKATGAATRARINFRRRARGHRMSRQRMRRSQRRRNQRRRSQRRRRRSRRRNQRRRGH